MGSQRRVEEKLRVLHVILRVNETNGQYNEHCLPLRTERDISICTYFPPELTPPPELHMFAGDGTLRGFLRMLRRAVRAKKHDVIHVHAPQSGALVILAMLGTLTLGRYRGSMVYTVQDSWYDYSRRNQLLMTIALAGFKRIIFCSRSAHESMPRSVRRLVSGRWDVVQNAADIERVDRALGSASLDSGNDFSVLAVGRLEPVKDPWTLLEAFARLESDGSTLALVGTGSLESAVATDIERLGLAGAVTMTGLIPRDEVFVRCAEADLLVSTSHGEGLPVAVIEAMAARCPVVLSDIPPHRELADGAVFIPLVDVGDVDGFAGQMARFLEMPATERAELGELCREHVLARFTLPIMHEGTEAAYHKLPALARVLDRAE